MVIEDLKKEICALIGSRDAQLLITSMLDITITEYTLNTVSLIDKNKYKLIVKSANEIKNGKPLQYVVGSTEFMSLKFEVSPHVLIPRPDTETLVEYAIDKIGNSSARVIDIGTGSGCIAISIAKYCKNAKVTSADISNEALKTAKHNAELNDVNINFINCDILNSVPDGKFDYIVSNPPYIPSEIINTLDDNVKNYEPITALDGGIDGLDFYRKIIEISPLLLVPGGNIMFEVGYDQADLVKSLMSTNFKNIIILKDLCGIDRVICGELNVPLGTLH